MDWFSILYMYTLQNRVKEVFSASSGGVSMGHPKFSYNEISVILIPFLPMKLNLRTQNI